MRRRLIIGEVDGIRTSARTPSREAAYAKAAPWLPPLAATTPVTGSASVRSRLKAPRVLNEPACWSNSSLRQAPAWSSTGVRRTWGAIRRAACSTSSGDTRAAGMALEAYGTLAGGGPALGEEVRPDCDEHGAHTRWSDGPGQAGSRRPGMGRADPRPGVRHPRAGATSRRV